MPNSEPDFAAAIPRSPSGWVAPFADGSPLVHALTVLAGGVAWAAGYLSLGASGRTLALVAGGLACGVVLGVGFTRALGGPALNLTASLVWPSICAGAVAVSGGFPVERLVGYGFVAGLLLPSFGVTLGSMLAWFSVLGVENIDDWTRRNYPASFFHDDGEVDE